MKRQACTRIAVYWHLARMTARVQYTYRFALITLLLSVLVQVYICKMVWIAVYAQRVSVDGIDIQTMIVYVTLANLQTWLLSVSITGDIAWRVRQGLIAYDLMRPVGFLGQYLARQIGKTMGTIPFLILMFPLAVVLGGMAPPNSPQMATLYLLSLGLAYLVAILLNLLIGMVSFWTVKLDGFLFISRFVAQLFSGTLIPLWFFPSTIRRVAELLPFQSMTFIPVSIYLNQQSGEGLLRALIVQTFWIGFLILLIIWVWHRAIRRVSIQGG
jgi:ABC-2 type transport system permease protein